MIRDVTVSAEVYQYIIDELSGELPSGVPMAAVFLELHLDPIRTMVGERYDDLTETPGHPGRRHFVTPMGWGVIHVIAEMQLQGHIKLLRMAIDLPANG